MVEGVHAIHCLVAWFIQQQERSGNGHAQSQPPPPPVVVTLLLGVCVCLCVCEFVYVYTCASVGPKQRVFVCVRSLHSRACARVCMCLYIKYIYMFLGLACQRTGSGFQPTRQCISIHMQMAFV